MSLDPVLQIFFDEAEEVLRAYEAGVLGLERAPGDRDLLNSIFRAVHTLKGNSLMLGFERIATVSHALEELLSRLRKGDGAPTPPIVNTLLATSDVLRALVTQARTGDETEVAGIGALIDTLADLAQEVGSPVRTVGGPVLGSRGSDTSASPPVPITYEVCFSPPGDLLRRGLDPLRLVESLGQLGELVRCHADADALPALDAMDPEACYLAFTCWLRTAAPRRDIEACFEFIDDPAAVTIRAVDVEMPLDGTGSVEGTGTRPVGTPVPAPGYAHAGTSGDAHAGTGVAKAREPVPFNGVATAREPVPSNVALANERLKWASENQIQSIRVATEKVDRLVDLVGEVVITQSMVAQLVNVLASSGVVDERVPKIVEAVSQMDRHARDLEERVMAIRMLPIRTVFGRFPRVVRDLAQAQGKRVEFVTRGEETELDKTVIERIGDPLMHLVRNAVDHGLEPPAARRARGKGETGRLVLAAYQQGGNIYIEIEDDGHGLDRERILAKALANGLVQPDETLTDEQVHAFIFHPGFSTAEQVTEVSGRGVGLDVVKSNVESLGGSVSIQTAPGRGTTFRVKLPLTLAILEGQSLRVGNEVYVLPLATITESIRPKAETLKRVFGSGEAFIMRGEILPFLRLHRVFRVPDAVEDPTRGLTVVVEHDGRRVALLVDELLGQQSFVIKSLDSNFQRVDGVAGATILGDGRVALILDVPGLVALGRAA